MSYPDPRYLGDTGEVSAWFRPASTAPELTRPGGGAAAYLATGAQTGGRFGLYRWDMGTEPGGADPHFHRTFSESFFVLSGSVQLYDGRAWSDAGPGEILVVLPTEATAALVEIDGRTVFAKDGGRLRALAGARATTSLEAEVEVGS